MAIVTSQADGTFKIALPDNASPQQKQLKDKIEALLASLQPASDGATIQELRAIAEEGFDRPNADPQAAAAKVDTLVAKATRPKPKEPEKPSAPAPRLGAFEVTIPDPRNDEDKGIGWQELIFNVTGELVPVPPEQLNLKANIETTLTTLQAILPDANEERPRTMTATQHRFAAYQTKLLGIAQTGLQTPADPESSQRWLASLQEEILLREGPRIKNSYMRTLGMWAGGSAVLAAVLYLFARNNAEFSILLSAYRNLLVLWTGTMIGTWLSFGLRRPKIVFKDLASIEDDMVEPAIRLIFTGLISFTIALIFACGMVNVNVGGLNSANLLAHGSSALLIGLLLGVSEQALPGALTRRASQFVSEIGGKT